ncbi:MAG: DNA alkylation repair protein [Candidatus Caldatribacteriaceae bacterium]
MTAEEIMGKLRALSSEEAVQGMRRFGITPKKALGVSLPELRKIARRIGVDHGLAQEFWSLGIRETMLLASMVENPRLVTENQMEAWAADFDNWEICDQVCGNLFIHTDHVYHKIFDFAARDEEFIKRASFAMIAELAFHENGLHDEWWETIFPLLLRKSQDERRMVKKAVSWALRQIGKRNAFLWKRALETAYEMKRINSRASSFIASETIRELNSDQVKQKLGLSS